MCPSKNKKISIDKLNFHPSCQLYFKSIQSASRTVALSGTNQFEDDSDWIDFELQ